MYSWKKKLGIFKLLNYLFWNIKSKKLIYIILSIKVIFSFMNYLKIKHYVETLFVLIIFSSNIAFTMEGYNEDGQYIEIEPSHSLNQGDQIELYNRETNEYSNVEIQRLFNHDSNLEIEVFDYETGKYEYLEIED